MSRIAKSDVNAALQRTAKLIVEAGGSDGRTSRAEMTLALKGLTGTEKKLADVFFKFIDSRDFKTGAQVTKKDVERAVAYAKEHMVARYDLDHNGLSASEVKKMSLTGKLAVDLAKSLKSAAGGDTAKGLATQFADLAKNVRFSYYGDESDDAWRPAALNSSAGPLTVASFKSALGLGNVKPEDQVTERSAAEFFTAMADTGVDAPLGSDAERADYRKLGEAMNSKLQDLKVFLVGADSVIEGHVYLVGRAPDGNIAGLESTRIWT